jgi:hypothetical protein
MVESIRTQFLLPRRLVLDADTRRSAPCRRRSFRSPCVTQPAAQPCRTVNHIHGLNAQLHRKRLRGGATGGESPGISMAHGSRRCPLGVLNLEVRPRSASRPEPPADSPCTYPAAGVGEHPWLSHDRAVTLTATHLTLTTRDQVVAPGRPGRLHLLTGAFSTPRSTTQDQKARRWIEVDRTKTETRRFHEP